jgi:hypothetical protein
MSRPKSRKIQNLVANPACTLSARLDGIDLVLEGEATRVTDRSTLQEVAGQYRQCGWPIEVNGDVLTAPFSAPITSPPPWHLYRFRLRTAFGIATVEPYGSTRWQFDH